MSGTFHETTGYIKRKFGEFSDDPTLAKAGREQQLLGKVHRLVGSVRGLNVAALDKLRSTRVDGHAICRKHGGILLDLASDFVNDIKNLLFK